MTFTLVSASGPNRAVADPKCPEPEFQKAVKRWNDDQAKKLHSDLERQLKEEIKSESEDPLPSGTMIALRQKFGLAALPTAKEMAKSLQETKRLVR